MNTSHTPQSSNLDEIVISYLDGELPIEQEDTLFSNLAANNEDIRSSMRDMISIRTAVQSDIEAFTAPPSAQEAVFSSLGMSRGVQASATTQSTPHWKKALLPLLFLAAGIGGGYGISEYNTGKERNELVALMQAVPDAKDYYTLTSQGISPSVPTIILEKKSPVKIVYKDRVMNVASVTPMITLPPIAVNQPGEQSSIHQGAISDNSGANNTGTALQNSTNDNTIQQESNALSNNNKPADIVTNIESKYPQFWTQLRSISPVQSANFSGVQSATSITDNIRLTFAYSLGENFAIGMEGGREQFALQYEGVKEEKPFQFNQISPMLTGGLFIQGRTNSIDFMNNARVYCNGFIGGSEIGLLGRIGAGLLYPITDNISINAGIEQSRLNFQYQGNWFTSNKLDLLYGITISF